MQVPVSPEDDLELVMSKDGSLTVFSNHFNEHYHSQFGAIQESKHIFIDSGLKQMESEEVIHILEVGFGTGLNALLSLAECRLRQLKIEYTGVELYPVPQEFWHSFNYHEHLEGLISQKDYLEICNMPWNTGSEIIPGFFLKKLHASIHDIFLANESYDLIYYDAFSPGVQPEMWTERLFSKLFNCLRNGGFLVTYSCKGTVKQALRKAGFIVKRLPGPPGKREMLRALKNEELRNTSAVNQL